MGVGGLRVSPVPLRWCIGGAPYCLTVPPTLLAQADDVNRIGVLFAAVHESLVGTKRTCRGRLKMSAHRGKADLALRPRASPAMTYRRVGRRLRGHQYAKEPKQTSSDNLLRERPCRSRRLIPMSPIPRPPIPC